MKKAILLTLAAVFAFGIVTPALARIAEPPEQNASNITNFEVDVNAIAIEECDNNLECASYYQNKNFRMDLFAQLYGEVRPKADVEAYEAAKAAAGDLFDATDDVLDDIFPLNDAGQSPTQSVPRRQGGLIRAGNSYIAALYDHPVADTQTYVAYVMNSAGIGLAQPAYAQGLGFSALSPVLDMWITFRNVAYLFFVLAFLVTGFFIMTRKKVGQAAITAQQAIPNIIIALVTVTFSYAIAGLMIDLMYLIMYFLIGVLGGPGNDILSTSLFQMAAALFKGQFADTKDAVKGFIEQALGENLLGVGAGYLGGLTAAIIIGIAVVFAVFQLFFELLRTYISILLSVILSPLILMMGAIPGRSQFGGWVNGLFGNLMAFPTVLTILIIYDRITGGLSGTSNPALEQGGFTPPFLFNVQGAAFISYFVGIGMVLVMKDLVVQSKKAFGAKSGVLDQFGNLGGALKDTVGKAWSGGQLVPGVGFTDTSKFPGGGLTGKNLTRKAAVGAYSVPVGAAQSAVTVRKQAAPSPLSGQASSAPGPSIWSNIANQARNAGSKLGDQQIKNKSKTP